MCSAPCMLYRVQLMKWDACTQAAAAGTVLTHFAADCLTSRRGAWTMHETVCCSGALKAMVYSP